ncbi:short-chain dehydrogenase [Massilia violaceinigra]|uniref:Short-chain dehydrogenase n=1 Tax=Massilia violaceinigra TaxID=2045208 RepID=A0A2D2DNL5_9BURK|nr:SDR family oxidoreductase [Massilia violaceinigra]ATQ76561.1 short-chain dehydrogenase [Massilia violaceinigra]
MTGPVVTAVVSGHTQGIGAAVAAELMTRGIAVLGLARGTAPELAARFGPLLREHQADLADSAALAAWLATPALRDFVGASPQVLLINNAGTVEPVGALHDQDPLAVAQAVALNVAAPMMLAAAVATAARQADCRILHVSSGAARNAYTGWSVYGATKAALDHHARAVALDYPLEPQARDAGAGVRICSLAPGVIDTAMQARIRATPESRFPQRERFIAFQRDGALGSPEQCAAGIVDYMLAAGFGHAVVDDLRAAGSR